MYKRKLFYFGLATAFILSIALFSAAITAHLTKENLQQSNIAQTLLVEHERLSGISYRLFKQLTDEVIFGQSANQADVRKKQTLILETIDTILTLETQQRDALGVEFTQGSIEDTDELARLINSIIAEFESITQTNNPVPLSQQEQLRRLLEVTIDDEFREAINAAVSRQSQVVTAINTRITTLNTTILWLTTGLGALALPLIVVGCFWLFNQLYQPLNVIGTAANKIAKGDYDRPISITLDDEFDALALTINQLAERLKQHEKQEVESRRLLETEVKQRTRELTEANAELTKVDTRRRQFIADVSHELRTPLTIIRGETQVTLRMKSASNEDYRDTLESVLDQAVNLSRLVDDLLLLTRAEMNQLNLELRSVDIKALLHSHVEKWALAHPKRAISYTDKTDCERLNSQLDTRRIQQVLSILLDNAVKYSAPDKPIEMSLVLNDNLMAIAVVDFGDGISATEIENVFERFVRFSKGQDGLGLGLPIAKAIVEEHGGFIQVDSTLGQGSTFTVYLPTEQTL